MYIHGGIGLLQRALLEVAKEKINGAISTKLDINLALNRFNIADFGCSTGPNTFLAVQNIIDAVEQKYPTETQEGNIEFQVLFNDHSNNDFNTLFKTLPPTKKYFVAGVPGSFFGRVLPRDSLHVGHCSYSLHWLSQVPKGVADKSSPAWNKDIHCTGFTKEVAEAYHDQFMIDMGSFLKARGEEFVSGGLLFLLGSCLPDGVKMSETMKGMLLDFMGKCLHDVAKEVKNLNDSLINSFLVAPKLKLIIFYVLFLGINRPRRARLFQFPNLSGTRGGIQESH